MKSSLVSRLRRGFYTLAAGAFLGSCVGSGDGPVEPKPEPRLSQITALENFVDINYRAKLENVSLATRKIFYNGNSISADVINSPEYPEILKNKIKGDYVFVLEAIGAKPDTAKISVPNYQSEASNLNGLDLNVNEKDSIVVKLKRATDKNLEDNPVHYTGVTSLDGRIEPSIGAFPNDSILKIKAIGTPGNYSVELSRQGSLEKIILRGEILDVPEPGPLLPYKIAFWGRRSEIDGSQDWEIYSMNSDGSQQTQLTKNSADDWGHRWSPDASKIAFSSRRDGDWEIYVMNADGSKQINLSQSHKIGADSDEFPAWSPDGSKIAFASTRNGKHQIYVMNADGSEQKNISNAPFEDIKPVWSPDGKKIAFYSYDGKWNLLVMEANGSDQIILADAQEDEGPKWSPDAGRILFTRNSDIIVRYPNREENLSNHPADDAFPVWSPDGNRVAFSSKRDGNWEIYTMNKDGSGLTRLTHSDKSDVMPSWSPDGSWITFMSDRDSSPKFEIYVMKADGKNQTRLTYKSGDENEPRWSPK